MTRSQSGAPIRHLARIVAKPVVHFAGIQIPPSRQVFAHAYGEMDAMPQAHADHDMRI